MDVQGPSPKTTLLILLGASEWPFMPEFQRSEAFANAARRLKAYFLNPRPFGLPAENLLDVFDSDKSADELDMEIGQFLQQRLVAMKAMGNAARDLLLYFVGHGGFVGRDSDFYLAIRCTRMENPQASGLQVESLAYTLTDRARYLRRIIILDCCFAAAAFSAFQAGPDQVALQKTSDAFHVGRKAVGFPTKGTTLLCSSNQKSPSLLLPDGSSTMFTKAFLDALVQGTPSQQDRLTLRDVKDVATDFLSEIRNAPKPVVHSPDQSEGDVADIPFFPNPRIEEERLRRAEEDRRRQAEEEQARNEEEERLRKAEEEQVRKIEEEARARQVEEGRRRRAEQEARAHQAEENRRRQAEEERLRKTEEPQSDAWLFRDPVVVETETLRSDRQRFKEPIREESYTTPQPALGRPQSGRGRLFYPTLALITLLVITLAGGGVFYFLRANDSQTVNQVLDTIQQQINHTQASDPASALMALSTAQKSLGDVQNNHQLDGAQMQRVTDLQGRLVSKVNTAIATYNHNANITVLPCLPKPVNNSSTQTHPQSIVYGQNAKNEAFLYTLAQDNNLYLINNQNNQYSMVSSLPPGQPSPTFLSMASNGSLLFLVGKLSNSYYLSVFQPGPQGVLGAIGAPAPIGSPFTDGGYVPAFITAWGNNTYVVLTQSGQGNARIVSYVLDTKGHLSTPKKTEISISAPIVSIAAFPNQLFLLLSSGDVQSMPLLSGSQPSPPPAPVLAQPPIAMPLATNGNAFTVSDPVPTVTTVTPNNPKGSAPLSVPSALPASTAMLTAGQVNHTPHLYIGDPVNQRVLDLEAASGTQVSPAPSPTGTNVAASYVKLQLDQQYVSYSALKQVKSLAVDPQGKQLAVLSQKTPSMTNLVSLSTGTPTGCA